MSEVQDFLRSNSSGDIVHQRALNEAVRKFSKSAREIEEAALTAGLLPARYQRNRKTLGIDQQLSLLKSRIAVIGCGGLGGYLIEELARLGAGTIVAVDPDHFEEHNLNRQVLCTLDTIGQKKAVAAADRSHDINRAVHVVSIPEAFGLANASFILNGCNVAVDALDSIPARVQLARACFELGIPLVHGAIAGWFGQVAIQMPGERTVLSLLEKCGDKIGIEKEVGNPAFAPAFVASLQTAEVCKLIVNGDSSLKGRMLYIDLFDMRFEEMSIE